MSWLFVHSHNFGGRTNTLHNRTNVWSDTVVHPVWFWAETNQDSVTEIKLLIHLEPFFLLLLPPSILMALAATLWFGRNLSDKKKEKKWPSWPRTVNFPAASGFVSNIQEHQESSFDLSTRSYLFSTNTICWKQEKHSKQQFHSF